MSMYSHMNMPKFQLFDDDDDVHFYGTWCH